MLRPSGDPRVEEAGLRGSLENLGRFVTSLDWGRVAPRTREKLVWTLLDTVGVIAAGARTDEMRALVGAWAPEPGPARLIGAGRDVVPDAAAYLNGVSAVCLELDEGNKHARGHPASHAFPAALAVAAAMGSSGQELASALLAGYEVAARFGRATRLREGVHPHGNWGVAGAAAACARLMRLDPERVAGALDAAGGMALATPFESALVGNDVRNLWVGAANQSGIVCARLAAAGLARPAGTAASTLGDILGELDAEELSAGLGTRWDIAGGYVKRHASCSFTHPPADAVLRILAEHPGLETGKVRSILVETHRVAAPLDRTACETRLAAMFSIPYVVAVALREGGCPPSAFDDAHRGDPHTRRLMGMTRVVATPEFDRRLPAERAARVTVELEDGSAVSAEVPNPVGDADHEPLDLAGIRAKLEGLLDLTSEEVRGLEKLVRRLLEADDVNDVLVDFP